MYNWGGDFLPSFGLHVHALFGITAFLGLVFLVIWAIKEMNEKELKKWTIWLLVVGIVGILVTSGLGYYGAKTMMGDFFSRGGQFEKFDKGRFGCPALDAVKDAVPATVPAVVPAPGVLPQQ